MGILSMIPGLAPAPKSQRPVYSTVYVGSMSAKCTQSANFADLGDQFALQKSCASQGFTVKQRPEALAFEDPDVYLRPNKL